MNQIELRDSLTASLSQMYYMEVIGSLAEFWQGELRVLLYVYQHSDTEISPSVLSEAIHVSRARITTSLSALRKKKYIVMKMCKSDRRRMNVMLTAEGESFVRRKQEEVERHFDVLVNGLGEENVIEFIRLIELSIQVIDKDENAQ